MLAASVAAQAGSCAAQQRTAPHCMHRLLNAQSRHLRAVSWQLNLRRHGTSGSGAGPWTCLAGMGLGLHRAERAWVSSVQLANRAACPQQSLIEERLPVLRQCGPCCGGCLRAGVVLAATAEALTEFIEVKTEDEFKAVLMHKVEAKVLCTSGTAPVRRGRGRFSDPHAGMRQLSRPGERLPISQSANQPISQSANQPISQNSMNLLWAGADHLWPGG